MFGAYIYFGLLFLFPSIGNYFSLLTILSKINEIKVGYSLETIKQMYNHSMWSNQQILNVLRKNDIEQVRKLFAHILCAERVWLTRLNEKDSSEMPIWTDIDIEECAALVNFNKLGFTNFIANITESNIDQVITYKNSKGIEFTNTIHDILTHVALHGHYHRGQISMKLRLEETEPVNVDYITYMR